MDLIKASSKDKYICEVFIVAEHAVIMIYSRHEWNVNFNKFDKSFLTNKQTKKAHTKLNFGTSMNRSSKVL